MNVTDWLHIAGKNPGGQNLRPWINRPAYVTPAVKVTAEIQPTGKNGQPGSIQYVTEWLDLVRSRMKFFGYQAKDVADLSGLSDGFIRNAVQGVRRPSPEALDRICAVLAITASDWQHAAGCKRKVRTPWVRSQAVVDNWVRWRAHESKQ
jgi:hypothetical protein